jgi:hypothetical protein
VARERYRINDPTIAIFYEDGRHVSHTIAVGTIVVVDGAVADGRMLEVTWDDKKAMMFPQDLLARAERLE